LTLESRHFDLLTDMLEATVGATEFARLPAPRIAFLTFAVAYETTVSSIAVVCVAVLTGIVVVVVIVAFPTLGVSFNSRNAGNISRIVGARVEALFAVIRPAIVCKGRAADDTKNTDTCAENKFDFDRHFSPLNKKHLERPGTIMGIRRKEQNYRVFFNYIILKDFIIIINILLSELNFWPHRIQSFGKFRILDTNPPSFRHLSSEQQSETFRP
jgi:hypothetical protein